MAVERPILPYLEVNSWQGLHTKFNPTVLSGDKLLTSQNTDYFNKYQGISKLRGSKRILSEIYKESSVVKPISWVGFYNYPDLDGQILRKVLIAAGTTIQEVNSDGTLTSLATGRTSGLIHSWDNMDEFLLISNVNPNLVGQGDTLLKYDGQEVTNWGVKPPGDTGTTVETFDDSSEWTTSNATVADETTITRDGTSIKLTQDTSDTVARITKDRGAANTFSAPSTTDDRVQIKIFIPSNIYDNLRTSSHALEIKFSSDSSVPVANNEYTFTFFIGQLNRGWTTLAMDFSSAPSGVIGSSAGTLDTDNVRVTEIAIHGAATSSGVIAYFDELETLEVGEPTGVFVDTSGSVFSNDATSGIYRYRVTYVTKFGLESNAGPSLTMDNRSGSDTYAQVDLSGIPVSSDSQVVARRLYRTIGGGGTFLRLTTINDNVTTTHTDTVPDGSLGTSVPPTAGNLTVSNDHSPPPDAGIVKEFKKTLFLTGDPLNPTLLYYSNDSEPEQFPLFNTINFNEVITGMFETSLGLVVTTESGYWRILGDNPNFDVEKVLEGFGAVGRRAVGTSRLIGWAIDRDGLRLYDLRQTIKSSEVIRDKYDALDRTNIETLFSTHSTSNNAILQFNKNSSGDVDSVFMYQYYIDDVSKGVWSELDFPDTIKPLDATEVLDATTGDPKLYVGGEDGMLYEWFSKDSEDWVNAAGTVTPMSTIIESPYLRLGEAGREIFGMTGRIIPHSIEIAHTGDPCTWQFTLETADGVDQPTARDSKTINMEFGSNNSLLRFPINKLHGSEYLKYKIENSEAGKSSSILLIRIYFYVRSGQYLVTEVDNS